MRFDIHHGKFQVIIEGDVRHTALKVSEAFPGEEIWVFALNRGRLCALDGVITQDITDPAEYYDLSVLPDQLQDLVIKQWRELIVGEVTTGPFNRRATLKEMYPNDPTQWATYKHLIGRVDATTVFFIDGEPLHF